LRRWTVAVHGAAFLPLFMAALPWPSRTAVAAAVLISLYVSLRGNSMSRNGRAVHALQLGASGQWRIRLAGGEWHKAELLPGNYVHPLLMLLGFRCRQGRRYVVLLDDSADEDELRRLRVWLTWAGPPRHP